MARRCVYKGSLDGSAPIYKIFQVNDSQTIYAGDIVVLSSGKASIAADGASAGTVLGVSATSITTTTATASDVIKVDVNPMSIYEMPYTGSATPAVGTKYDLGTAAYELDADDTTDGWLQVVPQEDGSGANTDDGLVNVVLCNRVYGMA